MSIICFDLVSLCLCIWFQFESLKVPLPEDTASAKIASQAKEMVSAGL